MGSLIANQGQTTTPPAQDGKVTNDGFWPDVDLSILRAATRLSGNVTAERLYSATVDAVLTVNDQLRTYRAAQIGQGWEKAEDIGETVAGASALVHRYLRAVYSSVQADMAERYRDWDSTRAGDYRGQGESDVADDFRRNAHWAVSDILGRPRNTVELL
ncbi:head completion/stabilization protein [Dyella sp. ASV21]|uniref:head completion/stabilization protein n=1 Tax=Dyella sp. ASV21 TaxID=2795114 RepID=UPI0018EB3988|nr:head completion/stabilization protein [Dyella sp. ASV21]